MCYMFQVFVGNENKCIQMLGVFCLLLVFDVWCVMCDFGFYPLWSLSFEVMMVVEGL